MKKIDQYVIKLSDIPQEVREGHWLMNCKTETEYTFVQVHIPEDEEGDKITDWISSKYPELVDVDAFLIQIDI